jgi:CheY-like chemotaxis protein
MRSPILFVDDSAIARATATKLLRERGLGVTALGSSKEAEGVDPTLFSAALLDIDLGDGFGPDIAGWLRRVVPALPIAFLTAGGPGAALLEAQRFGPVFSKSSEVDAAVDWIADAVAART